RVTLFADEISRPSPPSGLSMRLRPFTARLCWIMVLVFHGINGAYSLCLAYVYHFLARPEMNYYVKLLQLMPQDNYDWIITLYACISATNFYSAAKMLFWTIYYRCIAYGKIPTAAAKPRQATRFFRGVLAALSVRGQLFDTALLVRELVEIASQAYQAHSSSFLVSTVWINQLYGALLFFNCIANTAVFVLKRDETGVRRFLCTAIDLFLDFTWSSVLPTHIALQYVPMFIESGYSFPPEFLYSDTLYLRAILDFKQLFMVSTTDAVTTMLPYLNMFLGLRNLKILLHQEAIDAMGEAAPLQSATSIVPELQSPPPPGVAVTATSQAENENKSDSAKSSKISWLAIAGHSLMPTFGVLILAASIHAGGEFQKCSSGCMLQMHPWFSTHCACSALEISCYREGIEGSAQEVTRVLDTLDERVLNSLIFTHCPALTIPSPIQRFRMLTGLEFYNISLVSWPREASLSLPYLPRLGYVYIVRSRLDSGIPEGLTHNLAPNIVDIEFIASDVTAIPDDLADKWPAVVMLYIEHCGLQEFPRALASMALTDLSLVGNNISRIPDDIAWQQSLMYVLLDRNPLVALPENMGDMNQLRLLTVQRTEMNALPQRLTAKKDGGVSVNAFGTPLCQARGNKDGNFVLCSQENPYTTNGVFSLELEDELRRLH
ncbi:hypothetical protein PybrP1_003432, partial [[Pythium] brassicae (nom. inval.)]